MQNLRALYQRFDASLGSVIPEVKITVGGGQQNALTPPLINPLFGLLVG